MHFNPRSGDEEDTFEGPWEIVQGSDDFEGLSGGGDLSAVRDVDALTITQLQVGEIQYG